MAGVKGRSGGHNRKPTALKILQGNPGRRPLNDREPKPAPEVPTCPAELSAIAKREWRRIAPLLHRLGLVSLIDRAALAAYCATYGDFIEAEARIRQAGNLVRTADGSGVRMSPLFRMRNMALDLMQRYLTEFGMSPASRTRVRADVAKAIADMPEDEAFLASRGLRIVK